MKTNRLLFVKLSLIFAFTLSCGEAPQETTKTQAAPANLVQLSAKQIASLGIQTQALQQSDLGLSIYANGVIEVPPQNKSYVAMPFGGYIKKINVLDGMRVAKGQVLMVVEHPEIIQLQQDFLETQGELEYLVADFERQKQLFEKEAGSAKTFQQAKSSFQIAKAKLAGLTVKLEMANVSLAVLKKGQIQREQQIRSPFTGVITKVSANVGAFAEPKDNLLEIIDLQHAHAEITVYEKYLAYLKKGQQVRLKFVDTDTKAVATIYLIGREISPERTVKVHCHFEKIPAEIIPGSYLSAEIRAKEQAQYVVPTEAVVQHNGKDVVFIRQGNNFLPIPIDILSEQDEFVAIQSSQLALLKRSSIVTTGAYELVAMLTKETE
jgi:cobalt-zinc-cadmium efflux system membrane fusion protein